MENTWNDKKWNLVIDVNRCNGCHNCFLAVKDEYVDNRQPGYFESQPRHGHPWIKIERVERGSFPASDVVYVPTTCNHCDDAPCQKAAPDVVKKRADGIVIIDPEKGRGRRDLVGACPYGAIHWNESLGLPQAWLFDAHLLDRGWRQPRCSDVCPTGALKAFYITDVEMSDMSVKENLTALRPELKTKPRVHYKNLARVSKYLVAGTVRLNKNGASECLASVSVRLLVDSAVVMERKTDAFGDFSLDIGSEISECVVEVSYDGNQIANNWRAENGDSFLRFNFNQ